jgi:signal peptidase II
MTDDAPPPLETPPSVETRPADATPSPTPRPPRVVLACAVAALALLALDLGTKHWALENLSTARVGALPVVCEEIDGVRRTQRLATEPMPLIGEIFSLEYAENCSAAFGLARQLPAPIRRAVLATFAVVAVIVLFVALARGFGNGVYVWAVPFVAAGALGNMIDRVRLGYVVDFLHVQYRPWDFDYPVFNVADIVIAVGVTLLVLSSFGASRAPAPASAPPAPG